MPSALPATLAAYRRLSALAAPFATPLIARRLKQGKEDPERLGERRGVASVERPPGPLIWIHGASVGETVALMPLVARLLARGLNVLVTSGTVTSANLLARRLPALRWITASLFVGLAARMALTQR